MIRHRAKILLGLTWAVAFVLSAGFGGMTYFHFGNPRDTCASCHEMGAQHAAWSGSGHRTLACRQCHGGSLTLDVHALKSHLNRVVQHFARDDDAPIRLHEVDVLSVNRTCQKCHPQAFADWNASRHATNYARIFLDPTHNTKEVVASDCLRCHGMFYDGDAADLVTPLNKQGPWKLRDAAKATHPAIPCLACHQVHAPADDASPARFYDRREREYFPARTLPVVAISGARGVVKQSLDPRQRVCVQCHAPDATHKLGSSDDRTPSGVHEGLSCLDCHAKHNLSARASCATCHPARSNCRQDVEKMDTTFANPDSRHNIHRVACTDCHGAVIPTAKH